MSVTVQLLRVFRVDLQLRGLRTRLDGADRFLAEQERLFKDLDTRHSALSKQHKDLKASVSGDEGEVARVDARVAHLREQMNAAKTNKEYSVFLTELNNLKEKKDALEKEEIAHMEQAEALEKQLVDLTTQRDERRKIVDQARADRATKESEIRDRLNELKAQRDNLAKDVPADVLRMLEDLIERKGDDAMAHVEVLDRRNHEWTCGACMMALPVETVNRISLGHLTRCSHCQCILYTEEDVVSKTKKKQAAET